MPDPRRTASDRAFDVYGEPILVPQVSEHTMHCSEFRENHCAFIDDTLAGVELVRMQGHIAECALCAELDTRVRRSLMLARSIPLIELSADFHQKLEAKLQACRKEGLHEATGSNFRVVAAIGAVASVLMMGYMAESLHIEQGKVYTTARGDIPARDIVVSPAIATAGVSKAHRAERGATAGSRAFAAPADHASLAFGGPMATAAPDAKMQNGLPPAEIVSGSGRGVVPVSGSEPVAPEIIASVSAGMPLWPAALFAEQAPVHYANIRKPVH